MMTSPPEPRACCLDVSEHTALVRVACIAELTRMGVKGDMLHRAHDSGEVIRGFAVLVLAEGMRMGKAK